MSEEHKITAEQFLKENSDYWPKDRFCDCDRSWDSVIGWLEEYSQSKEKRGANEMLDRILKLIEETPTSSKTPIWSKKYFIDELKKLRT